MTNEDVAVMVGKLKGLFPKMGMSQTDFFADQFVGLNRPTVEKCIDDLAEMYGPEDCPSRPILLGMIDKEEFRLSREQVKEEMRAKERRMREQEADLVRRNELVDQFVNTLSDERLAQLRESVLVNSTSHLRALLSGRDPRVSAMLRDMIYEHLEAIGEAPPLTKISA